MRVSRWNPPQAAREKLLRVSPDKAVRDQGASAYTIRCARPQDIAELVALCKEHAHFERVAYDTAAKADRLTEALFSTSPRLYAWAAVAGERGIIGYATAAPEYSTWNAR